MTVGAPTVIFLTVGAQRSDRTLHKNVYISESSLCICVCVFYLIFFLPCELSQILQRVCQGGSSECSVNLQFSTV